MHAKDMIPRLSLGSMEALVQEMVHAGAYVRLPKIMLMLRIWLFGQKPTPEDVFCDADKLGPQQHAALEHYAVEKQVRQVVPHRMFASLCVRYYTAPGSVRLSVPGIMFSCSAIHPPSNIMEHHHVSHSACVNCVGLCCTCLQRGHTDSYLSFAHTFQPPGHVLYYERHKAPLHKDPCCCNPCLEYIIDNVQYKTRCVANFFACLICSVHACRNASAGQCLLRHATCACSGLVFNVKFYHLPHVHLCKIVHAIWPVAVES